MKDRLKDCINWLQSKGVDYADCRFVRTESESLQVSDENVDALSRNLDVGVGIRVLHKRAGGFAATAFLTAAELKKTASKALQIARASAMSNPPKAILAEQEAFVDHYRTPFRKDPFEVSSDDKINLLLGACKILRASKKIKTAEGKMRFFRTKKLFVSTEGADIEQDLLESGGGIKVISFDGKEAFTRSFPNSFGGDYGCAGYEFVEAMDLTGNAERVREEAIELLKAKPCPQGETTVIICASQMALQIHESCGHPTELDRVLGTENKLKYGSDIVNITADATLRGGLGTFGYDDEGVKAQRSYLIKKGKHVGYLSSRETAPIIKKRSNGTMRADGWNRLPLIRMTNINLEPGEWELDDLIKDTKNGIWLDINKSWSIDDKRLNFQFGGECAREIKNGKLGQMFKKPVYTGITPEFWNSCDAICNRNHWHIWGVPNCGKGEPMQTAHVAHGAAPTRFRNVKVGVSK